ncbi:hypothetical protein T265_07663 [Opisthorchis viverrini]|uniref:t-SNARE coiled-coil homology domain-containing protein n=1 Tax=Opisthorchis viverrini TaxID=6198 RepID=A0A074ZC98_OPIVI|nr:hypothetical protein T265_07663 [Opisthorchis viverrini]KER24778.1 hypothetical protein T265_07663 [Opisthorchis viverrini]
MACDISRIFQTIVHALETTGELSSLRARTDSNSLKNKPQNAFSFWNRASSLRGSLCVLAGYIKRVQQLTGTSLGSSTKQRLHSELTEQVTQMIDQCTTLLLQLKETSRLDELGRVLTNDQKQLKQHRQVVVECLEEEMNKLRRLKDMELERQRHLQELTGSLAGGIRSAPPSKPLTSIPSTDLSIRSGHPPADNQARHRPSQIDEDERSNIEETNLSEAELQAFERENRSIYEHLSEQRDELNLVARAISEISRLNQTLSTHLSEQLEVTQQIGENFTMSTEHIRQGNEFLRNALSNKASAQFWILFTMIVLTFSLHFLDWYYP